MSKKKHKISHSIKEIRRSREAALAQTKVAGRPTSVPITDSKQKSDLPQLPIKKIKEDIAFNFAYTLIFVVALILMSKANFGYEQLKGLLKF